MEVEEPGSVGVYSEFSSKQHNGGHKLETVIREKKKKESKTYAVIFIITPTSTTLAQKTGLNRCPNVKGFVHM